MWLGSFVAVAVAVAEAGSYSSNSASSLGTSICCGHSPKKKKKEKKRKRKRTTGLKDTFHTGLLKQCSVNTNSKLYIKLHQVLREIKRRRVIKPR